MRELWSSLAISEPSSLHTEEFAWKSCLLAIEPWEGGFPLPEFLSCCLALYHLAFQGLWGLLSRETQLTCEGQDGNIQIWSVVLSFGMAPVASSLWPEASAASAGQLGLAFSLYLVSWLSETPA